ncbi:MAG: hypothetical protein ACOC2G_01190 [Bacillota bacterium]
MSPRRKSYRLPEEKYEKLQEKLEKKDMEFDEFLDRSINLYLEGKLDPKGELDAKGNPREWGNWMQD